MCIRDSHRDQINSPAPLRINPIGTMSDQTDLAPAAATMSIQHCTIRSGILRPQPPGCSGPNELTTYHRTMALAPTIQRVSRRDRTVRTVSRAWRELTGGLTRGRDSQRRTLIACSGGADSSGLAIALASAVS